MDVFQRFDSFISRLSKKDNVAIIFHTDADGITAGVIAAKVVEWVCGRKPVLFLHPAPSEVTLSKKMISELKKKKINKAVIVDLNVDQEPASIKQAEKFAEILVLDHHSIQNDINSGKTVMIKPQLFSEIEPSKYTASKLAFDLFSRHVNLDDLKWLAAIGIYGDMAEKQWKDFIRSAGVSSDKIKTAGKLIIYARSADEKKGPMKAFREFYSARGIDDVLGSPLSEYAEKIERELSHYIGCREKLAEFYPDKKLMIYEISPRYNIKSELVNRLSREYYPNWTCIVIQKKGKTASIGARNQSGKAAMNELMIEAARGIKGASGGGHVQAAGGNVPAGALEMFKKRILGIFEK